jgi:hypothetical protein
MIGSIFRLGRSLEDKPLIFSSLYKTAVFCLFCAAFTLAEHTVVGLWKGEGLAAGLHEMAQKGVHEVVANTLDAVRVAVSVLRVPGTGTCRRPRPAQGRLLHEATRP